jgi:hypothetical protein
MVALPPPPPTSCVVSELSGQVAATSSPAPDRTWDLLVTCPGVDGMQVVRRLATRPDFRDGVCTYFFRGVSEPANVTRPTAVGSKYFGSTSVFERAATNRDGKCPDVISGRYTNIAWVTVDEFKLITKLVLYKALEVGSTAQTHIENVTRQTPRMFCDRFSVVLSVANSREGEAYYGTTVQKCPLIGYSVSALSKVEH